MRQEQRFEFTWGPMNYNPTTRQGSVSGYGLAIGAWETLPCPAGGPAGFFFEPYDGDIILAFPDLLNDPVFADAYAMTVSVGMGLYLGVPGAVSYGEPCTAIISTYPVEFVMSLRENYPDGPVALDYLGQPREAVYVDGLLQGDGDKFMGTFVLANGGRPPSYFWTANGFFHNVGYPMLSLNVLAYMTEDVYVPPDPPPPIVPPVDPPRFPPCGPAQVATVAGGPITSGVVAL